jgi:hypothetical protein
MYNSIQHFNEFGLRKVEKLIETFVTEKKRFGRLGTRSTGKPV